MTREEAIKILKSGSTFAYDEKEAGEFCEAYDMAIKALQAQDVDAVSRQAVMWMLTNLSYTQCRTQGEVEVIGLAKTMLIAMPSAQEVNNSNQEVNNSTATQPNGIESQASYRQVTGKLDVTDCISRQTAINAIENTDCELPPCAWDELTDAIMRVPSAQQWIPVSEMLPEEGERVLATHLGGVNPNRQVIEHIYQCGKFTYGWDMDMNVDSPTFGQRYMGEVIAWMPLPEPYGGEGD